MSEYEYTVYNYNEGHKYELGFKKHSGLVCRKLEGGLNNFLERERNFPGRKICIVIPYSQRPYGVPVGFNGDCAYVKDYSINTTKVDIMKCKLLNCIDGMEDIMNGLVLTMHVASLNNVDTLVFCDIGTDDNDELVKAIKCVSELYKCYLSNVYYV